MQAYAQAYTRRRLKPFRTSGTAQDLHDWRKRVKDHWYHVRLLAGLWPDVMTSFEWTLKDLETKLGDHHNLEVLKERIQARTTRVVMRKAVSLSCNWLATSKTGYHRKQKRLVNAFTA